jgi:membrane protein YdbS with pleckstrin-like domain
VGWNLRQVATPAIVAMFAMLLAIQALHRLGWTSASFTSLLVTVVLLAGVVAVVWIGLRVSILVSNDQIEIRNRFQTRTVPLEAIQRLDLEMGPLRTRPTLVLSLNSGRARTDSISAVGVPLDLVPALMAALPTGEAERLGHVGE